jgi:hypothetical protein
MMLALCAACGAKTIGKGSGPGQTNVGPVAIGTPADDGGSSDDSAACSLPGETCHGGCIAAGGTCLTGIEGSYPCTPAQVSTLSCGESAGAGLYCCLAFGSGIPIEAGVMTPEDGGADASQATDAADWGTITEGGFASDAGSSPASDSDSGADIACNDSDPLDPFVTACPAQGATICPDDPIGLYSNSLVAGGYHPGCEVTFPSCVDGEVFQVQCTCQPDGRWTCDGPCVAAPNGVCVEAGLKCLGVRATTELTCGAGTYCCLEVPTP